MRARRTSSTGSQIRFLPVRLLNTYKICKLSKQLSMCASLVYSNHNGHQVILNNALDNEKGTTDIQSALMYFDSISKYMQQLRTALEELRDDIEWGNHSWKCVDIYFPQTGRNVAQDELDAADNEKRIGIAILSFIRFWSSIYGQTISNMWDTQCVEESRWFWCKLSNICLCPLQPHHGCFLLLCKECTLDHSSICQGGDGKGWFL